MEYNKNRDLLASKSSCKASQVDVLSVFTGTESETKNLNFNRIIFLLLLKEVLAKMFIFHKKGSLLVYNRSFTQLVIFGVNLSQ